MKLNNGDIIRTRSKINPLYLHYGIVIKLDDNSSLIAHNPRNGSISLEKPEDFFKERNFDLITETVNIPASTLITRFQGLKSKQYDLYDYNCEDFINDMIGEKKYSYVKFSFWGIVILFAGIVLLLVIPVVNKEVV